MITAQKADALDEFLDHVGGQIMEAMARFPQPNPTITTLTEKVGEAARAALHIREGKCWDWNTVYNEAVQVTAMVAKLAIEDDPTVGTTPPEENQEECSR